MLVVGEVKHRPTTNKINKWIDHLLSLSVFSLVQLKLADNKSYITMQKNTSKKYKRKKCNHKEFS